MTERPSPLFFVTSLGMLLVFGLAVLVWQRRRPGIWPAVGLGMLAWFVAVVLKFAAAIPLNGLIRRGLTNFLGETPASLAFWIYVGLLTGVFECGTTLWFAARTRLKAASWNNAVAFGIGFGGFEAFVVGALMAVGLFMAIVFFDELPPEAKAELGDTHGATPLRVCLPVVERISALLIHVFSCVAILFAVRSRLWRWFWLAFGYKTLVDTLAVVGLERFSLQTSVTHHLVFEGVFLGLAALGCVGLYRLRDHYRELETQTPVLIV
jgi:uncharacterized membrane protein YhfC